MAVQVSYPGVYIEEFTPGAPIQGVSLSTAAFLGPAGGGPLMEPVQITSWDRFRQEFGDQPVPGYYLWYAVRGYLENGGQVCWVVRVSNAAAARWTLRDRNGRNTLVITAREPGAAGNSIKVKATPSHAISATVFEHGARIDMVSGTRLTLPNADAAVRFRPGDLVTVQEDQTARTRVLAITGRDVRLAEPLTAAQGGRNLRLANIDEQQGDNVLRLTITAGDPVDLAPGSLLVVTQGANSTPATVTTVVAEPMTLANGTTQTTYRTAFAQPLPDLDLTPGGTAATVQSEEFDLEVTPPTGPPKTYRNLAMNPVSSNYHAREVNNDDAGWVTVAPAAPPTTSPPPRDIPAKNANPVNLGRGSDEDLDALLPDDYQRALDTLLEVRGVSQVAIPDRTDATVQGYLIDHCQGAPPRVGERFAILDSERGAPTSGTGSVIDQRAGLTSFGGYGALYYPWILVPPAPRPAGSPPTSRDPILVPPSGHVAGIYARIDGSRGVHKAPAGEEAEVRGSLGVERMLGDVEQGLLNLAYGINVIRVFRPRGRPVVWGARTTATGVNASWQYVNIRRLFLFLEQSISAGIRWAVFEPNDLELWGKLRRTISAFLRRVWRDGALFGETPGDAFYVRIDEALNPPSDRALGRLTLEIGVVPAYPAEFIVVRIGIWEGGSEITEQ